MQPIRKKLLDFDVGSKPYKELFNVNVYRVVKAKESGNHKINKEVDVITTV
jgi:hypothetical protein